MLNSIELATVVIVRLMRFVILLCDACRAGQISSIQRDEEIVGMIYYPKLREVVSFLATKPATDNN